jgi:hypothetical protein
MPVEAPSADTFQPDGDKILSAENRETKINARI